jgi:hypothetical protein
VCPRICWWARVGTNARSQLDCRSSVPLYTWHNKVKVFIDKTREEAEQAAKNDESDIRIYTDRFSHNGGVGAAAVLIQGFHPVRITQYHLGRDTKHTVYESECVGQILTLKMLQKLGQNLDGLDIMIATDNQVTLQSYSARKSTPGSYLIEDARKLIKEIEEKWPRARLKM